MNPHRSTRPAADEFAPFYAGYIAQVPDGDVIATLAAGPSGATELLSGVSEEVAGRAYAPGKWTLKEVVQHCSDAERIFAYRALRIGRGDTTNLPGWDEQTYAPTSRAHDRTLASLLNELGTVRAGTLSLFEGFPVEAWTRRGRANEMDVSVRGIAWITAGHLLHHLDIVRNRYLV